MTAQPNSAGATAMTQRDAFLESILAEPDDDTPRLIFADWLDEHDDPLGEFIRVQMQLASLPEDDERRPELKQRERRLLGAHGREWARAVRPLVTDYEFRRGFVEEVRLDARRFPANAAALFRAAPIRQLLLERPRYGAPPAPPLDPNRLAACPELARVKSLNVDLTDGDALAALLGSPHLTNLTSLRLRVGDGGNLPALLHATKWTGLTALDLGANRLGLDGLQMLLEWWRFPAVTALRLNTDDLDSACADALSRSPVLGQLKALDLSYNNLGSAGAAALARSPYVGGLESLWLGFNSIGDPGAEALAACARLTSLRCLYLANNHLSTAAARALAKAPGLAQLTRLDLDHNKIPAADLQALAASPYLTRLRTLFLRCPTVTRQTRRLLEARFGEAACRF